MTTTTKIPNLGVDWFLPGMKRRFASTTQATSYMIALLGEDGLTFEQAHDALLFDPEGKAVLAHFIANGYGGALVGDHVRPN